MTEIADIARIFADNRVIAVVGLSDKPHRASHQVAQHMQASGYRIIPVNPACAGQDILGEPCFASLSDAAAALAPLRIDIVDCFRRAEEILPIAREAIAIQAKVLWMQLDIVNEEAAALARAAGLQVVMDRCLKLDHLALSH
jgi:predicted CoA-binding protein